MPDPGQHFLRKSAAVLQGELLPKIKEAVELLSDQEIWAREGDATNCVGNLLLHLEGNVRQHIISGVGGATDARNRPLEFAARGGLSKEALLNKLEETVAEAAGVLEMLDPAHLLDERMVQNKNIVLQDDILHVVEHFAYHAGQIILIAKTLKQHDFGWYKYLDS
ncbi:DUF1572 domain-containing protein [bacterium]|nr:DUF1572 domain-containing protein [bacterium]MBU1983465.1 DUF1572 domain-containing protein [bacterium]